jgi:glycosyltransferase involved in cell wall biosynthesis
MKVLHVIPSLSVRTGGPAVAVVDGALALRAHGIETTIIASDMAAPASSGDAARVTPADLPAGADSLDVRLFPAAWPRRMVFSPAMYRAVAAEARRSDVVHVHSLFLFPQFAAYRAARAAHVPHVVSPRGALDPYLRRRNPIVKAIADATWQRGLLEDAARLHLTSDEEAHQARAVAPRVPRAVIPNGVRWDAYGAMPSPDEFRRRCLAGSDAPLVMFLGRLSHKKGLDVLVRAFAIACREVPDALLAIVGPDDERLEWPLRALAASEGVEDRTVLTGLLTGEEKLAALAAADVWVLPSRGENFGNAVVEAMAASRACVISPEVNIAPEIAAEGAASIVPRTPEAFGAEIAALLRDAERRHALGASARAFARRYDWSSVGPRMADMYDEVARAA